jgi:hypothetical protein
VLMRSARQATTKTFESMHLHIQDNRSTHTEMKPYKLVPQNSTARTKKHLVSRDCNQP